MDLTEIYDKMKALSIVVDPSDEELVERITLCIQIYNARRDELTDEDIARTRAFLASDLYMMVSVCYQPALDNLIAADLELQRRESDTFNEEFEECLKTFSKSQSIDLARKNQKSNEDYLEAYNNFHACKNIVNIYDKTMKMGSQVLNSMARRARES